jgi:hypothetical protein
MLLYELFEAKKKPKSKAVRKKLKVKQKRHRKHVHPVKRVTDEGVWDTVSSALTGAAQSTLTYAAGAVLSKLGTGGS